LLEGMAQTRRIFASPALAAHSLGETLPGPAAEGAEALRQFAREQGNTIYHPVGTCKMGSDSEAVVDDRLRVHGINGLRVADASIMPEIINANTNSPSIMIGEKSSDMVLAEA